ncbi:hypothetical protein ACOSP7_028284 [Xanthoceras sorbifolium]
MEEQNIPYIGRLANIFGKDCANGKGAEVPSEMMEDISNNEGDDVNEDASPISINRESNYSRSNQGKRKRRSSDDGALVSVMKELVEVSAKDGYSCRSFFGKAMKIDLILPKR